MLEGLILAQCQILPEQLKLTASIVVRLVKLLSMHLGQLSLLEHEVRVASALWVNALL